MSATSPESVPYRGDPPGLEAARGVLRRLERWIADQELVDGSDWFVWFRDELVPAVEWAISFGVIPVPVHFDKDRVPTKHVGIKDWKSQSLETVWFHRIRDISGWAFQAGSAPGLVVVDVDRETFESELEAAGASLAGAKALVRSGSWSPEKRHKQHLYCRAESLPPTDVKDFLGADWLCDQQLVLGPSSRHPKGGFYSWAAGVPWEGTVADLPVVQLPAFSTSASPSAKPRVKDDLVIGDVRRAVCPPGVGRNDWTTRFLTKLVSDYVRRFRPAVGDLGGYHEDKLTELLLEAWERSPGHDWEQFAQEYQIPVEIQRAWDKAHADRRNRTYAACQVEDTEKGGLLLVYTKVVETKAGPELEERRLVMGDPAWPIEEILKVYSCSHPGEAPSVRPTVRVRLQDGRVHDLLEVLQFSNTAQVPPETSIKESLGMVSYAQVVPHLYAQEGRTAYAIPTGFWLVRKMHHILRHEVPSSIDWVFLLPSGETLTNVGLWEESCFVPLRPSDVAPDHTFSVQTFELTNERDVSLEQVRRAAQQVLFFHFPTYVVPLAGYYTACVLQGWFRDVIGVTVPHLGVTGASESGKSTYASAAVRKLHGVALSAGTSEAATAVALGLSRAGAMLIDDNDKNIRTIAEDVFRVGYDGGRTGNTKRSNPVWGRVALLAEDLSYITRDKANSRRCFLLSTPSGVTKRPSKLQEGGKQSYDYGKLRIEPVCEDGSELWVRALLDTLRRVDVDYVRDEVFKSKSESVETGRLVANAGLRIYIATALGYEGDPFDPDWDPVINEESCGYPDELRPLDIKPVEAHPYESNMLVQVVEAWMDDYRNRMFQQWGWTPSYRNCFTKAVWEESGDMKSFVETISSDRHTLVFVNQRLTFKLQDLARWFRQEQKRRGLRDVSVTWQALQVAAEAFDLHQHKFDGAGKWWRISADDTMAILNYLNFELPTPDEVKKAQLALEDK